MIHNFLFSIAVGNSKTFLAVNDPGVGSIFALLFDSNTYSVHIHLFCMHNIVCYQKCMTSTSIQRRK